MFLIAAPPKGSVKSLSKDVKAALKLILNQIEHFSFETQYYSGVKIF